MAPLDSIHFGCASASTFSSLEDVRYQDERSLDLLHRPEMVSCSLPTGFNHLSLLHRLPNEIVAYIYSFLGMRDLLNGTSRTEMYLRRPIHPDACRSDLGMQILARRCSRSSEVVVKRPSPLPQCHSGSFEEIRCHAPRSCGGDGLGKRDRHSNLQKLRCRSLPTCAPLSGSYNNRTFRQKQADTSGPWS